MILYVLIRRAEGEVKGGYHRRLANIAYKNCSIYEVKKLVGSDKIKNVLYRRLRGTTSRGTIRRLS